ncbi:MAG: EAL domain-containing protein [Gammaproteobacteria bacterium]|nr:EAL domain-containing protein [Gammaproteobacteria bacterium]
MPPRRLWPLWLKLTLALVAALALVAFLAGEATRYVVRDDLYRQLRDHNEKAFAMLSATTLEAVMVEDISALRTIVEESVQLEPDIHAVHVENEDGEPLVTWHRDIRSAHPAHISFSKDIRFEGALFGRFSIDWSAESLTKQVNEHVARTRLFIALSLALLTLIVIGMVHWLAVGPLGRIHRHLRALSSGDLEGHVETRASRELALLAASVNRLSQAIKSQKRREDELEAIRSELFDAKELAEVTLHSIGDGVITTDARGIIQYLNPVAEKLTGWNTEEAMGMPLSQAFFIVDETSRRPTRNPVAACLEQGQAVGHTSHILLISRTGKENAIEHSAAPIRGREGDLLGAVLIFHDNTPARRLARQIEYQASHDPLTKLANRREFEQRLKLNLEEARQDQVEHTLLYLDLDQFKVINDTCGHAAGDALLQQIAPLVRAQLRKEDVFGRLGGDEFGILLRSCSLEHGVRIADVVRATISGFRFLWQDKTFRLGVSIGVVSVNTESGSAEALLQAADEACYAAKENGRNRIHVFKADDRELAARRNEMQWVSEIHSALTDDRLLLYGQGIFPFSGGTGEGAHYEVLLRMRDKQGGLSPPGAFLPAAERYGLMPSLDRWVVQTVLKMLREHPQHLDRLKLCSINLSAASASDESFLAFMVEELQQSEVPLEKICFEITETGVVANLARARSFIITLQTMGCMFALDDFGSGMSSFAYLRDLPVDILKIEGAFVKDLAQDSVSEAMVKSINDIGHVMEKKTIAEFVEDEACIVKLQAIGVDYGQGYGLARPVPLEELMGGGDVNRQAPPDQLATSA